MNGEFLPVSREDMTDRGWYYYDFLLVTGDAYVDHPSFGTPVIGRLLESMGFRVAILAQPDWHGAEAFREVANASAVLISRSGAPAVETLCDAGEVAHEWISQAADDTAAFAVKVWNSVFSKDDEAEDPSATDVPETDEPLQGGEDVPGSGPEPTQQPEAGAVSSEPSPEATRYIYRYTQSPGN